MKLKPHILTATIALLTSAVFAAEPAKKIEPLDPTNRTSGKATITIDVNGKKETREIEFGEGTEVKVTTNTDGGGSGSAIAGASATAGQPKTVTWLGVAPEEVSEELRAQLPLEAGAGLLVRSVLPDSPAAKAGLQKNDVLMKIDDQLLTNPGQLRALVSAKKDGDTVKLTYFRRGQQATLDVQLATHMENPGLNLFGGLPNLGPLFQLHRKSVVVDKDGKVIGGFGSDGNETTEKLEKTLRDFGADDKTIEETKRVLAETLKAVRDAVSDVGVAKAEVQKGAGEIAKALEEVRDAVEKVRRQAEEAVRKERENRRAEKQP